MPPLMKTILLLQHCYSTCRNHQPAPLMAPRRLALDLREFSGGFAAEGPRQKCCPARANGSRVQIRFNPLWWVVLRNNQHLC